MKKRKLSAAVIIAALILVIGSIAFSFAAEGGPGTESDPIVTRSYVDKKINELKALFTASSGTTGSASWEVIEVPEGKSVIGGQGTEMILRSGQAVAVDNGVNGISDLTNAKDLMSGAKITANSLLLTPRDDGRGIKCQTSCFVMVLGSYTIK